MADPRIVPDVPDDVIDRLGMTLIEVACAPDRVMVEQTWRDHAEHFRDCARGLIAHLRAHPEDAAAVLGGEIERKVLDTENGDLWHPSVALNAGDVRVARAVGAWVPREMTP